MSSEQFDPKPDRPAATTLGDALRAVGYDEEGVADLLGDDGLSTDLAEVPVHERRLPHSPLATTIRLLLLQLPVPRTDAVEALGGDGLDALVQLQLAELEDDRVVPRARIVPAEDLLMAFDGFARGADDPVGFVAPYTPTASWLAALTPRPEVERALDVGTGNGVHALLAARHSAHVIATDVNERALAFTDINAALNGLDNVETRRGSLFEPVDGEQFDLIICNAPYVVSPESKWQYRDSGLPADEVSERVVGQAAAALRDDGFAALLVSWVATSEEAPDDRLDEWLEHSGCDAWVLGMTGTDPLEHAAGWNEHLGGDPEAYGAAIDEWVAYLDGLGVGWVSEGAVLLHRRDDATEHVLRIDAIDPEELDFAGDQVLRVFATHEALEGVDDVGLLDQRIALAAEVRVERVLDPGSREPDTVLYLEEGTNSEYELDPDVAEVVAVLDGDLTLGRAVERVCRAFDLDRRERKELYDDSLEELRDLLSLGIAELR